MTVINKIDNYLNEVKTMKVDDFVNKLDSIIRKHFPKSHVNVQVSKNLGKEIDVFFTLGKNKSEWVNKIAENDPLYHRFMLAWNAFEDNEFTKDKFEAELSVGGSLKVLPGPKSYMAFDRVKIGWRKKTGTPEAILKHFDNYFNKMKKVLKDNFDNMTEEDRELNKDKV